MLRASCVLSPWIQSNYDGACFAWIGGAALLPRSSFFGFLGCRGTRPFRCASSCAQKGRGDMRHRALMLAVTGDRSQLTRSYLN
jgi:hypothetical protein